MTFFPCPSCHRHVRLGDVACPFCSADVSASAPAMRALPRARLSRSATFLFASTLAVGACSGGEDNGSVSPVYGSPADTAISETAAGDAGKDGTSADTAADGATEDTSTGDGSVSDATSSDSKSDGNSGDAKADSSKFDGGPAPLYGAAPAY